MGAKWFRRINVLGISDLRDGRMRTVLQHFAPAERPRDRRDYGIVDVAGGG